MRKLAIFLVIALAFASFVVAMTGDSTSYTATSSIDAFGANTSSTTYDVRVTGGSGLVGVGANTLVTQRFGIFEYNATKGAISTVPGTLPFYTNGSNPVNYTDFPCLENMQDGDSCVVEWYVNATGDRGDTYRFFSEYESDNYTGLDGEGSSLNITIDWQTDTDDPVVTLVTPAANYYNGSSDPFELTFICNATDDVNLRNISLYLTDSTDQSFAKNASSNISGESSSTDWTMNLTNGNYTWNCLAYDAAGNWSFAAANRTITINSTYPTWDQPLTNQTIEYGTAFVYDINASDPNNIDQYSINDSNFNINPSTGNLTNATALGVGIYYLNVSVNDTFGNAIWALLTVNVTDTTAPTWDQPLTNQTIEYGTAFVYDVNASDLSNTDQYTINDSDFNINAANGNITNVTALAVGIYYLNVSVNDTQGNTLWGLLTVNVTDTSAPTWDQPLTNQTIGYGTAFAYDVNASDPNGIHTYFINNSDFSINAANGNITNATVLSVGVHYINVSVNDTQGNTLWTTLTVNVTDTIPPTWDQPLVNQTIGYGVAFVYDVSASDPNGIGQYAINNSDFNINTANGNMTNATILSVGVHYLNVSVNDSIGNILWTVLTVNVTDATPPTWDEPLTNQTVEYGTAFVYDVSASDPNGIHTYFIDNSDFSINATNGNITNATTLGVGVHNLNVSVNDSLGNILWALLTVNVTQTSPTCSLTFDKATPQTYNTQINASCSCTNPETSAVLWRDSSDVTSVENNNLITLAAGTYSYVCNSSATQNYTSATDSSSFTIDKATTILALTPSPSWSETYGTQTTINCTANHAQVTPKLYRNTTEYSIPDTQTLAANTYNYTCNASETQNYTSAVNTSLLQVSRNASIINLTLNGSASNLQIEYGGMVNITAELLQGESYISLYLDGSLINNGTSPLQNLTQFDNVGDYNVTAVYPESQNYSTSSLTLFVNVYDATEPFVQLVSPVDTFNTSNVNITLTCNATNLNLSNATLYTNISGWAPNRTEDVTGTSAEVGFNLTDLDDNLYMWNCLAYDVANNSATAFQNRTFRIDTEAPQYSALEETPSDSHVYDPAQDYEFNITWTDQGVGVQYVWLGFNGQNYTASGAEGEYNVTLTPLGVGFYSYTWYANDTLGHTNQTSSDYTVTQATPTCSLTFDKATPQTYNTQLNASCACTNPETSAVLWRDSTDVTTAENNKLTTLAAGTYSYVCNSSATQNYTSATNSSSFTIDKATTILNLTSSPSWSETYGQQTVINCTA
ncbi:beta strand repeat-containing protein, partial [Nanoarchaeota archaeon]